MLAASSPLTAPRLATRWGGARAGVDRSLGACAPASLPWPHAALHRCRQSLHHDAGLSQRSRCTAGAPSHILRPPVSGPRDPAASSLPQQGCCVARTQANESHAFHRLQLYRRRLSVLRMATTRMRRSCGMRSSLRGEASAGGLQPLCFCFMQISTRCSQAPLSSLLSILRRATSRLDLRSGITRSGQIFICC